MKTHYLQQKKQQKKPWNTSYKGSFGFLEITLRLPRPPKAVHFELQFSILAICQEHPCVSVNKGPMILI